VLYSTPIGYTRWSYSTWSTTSPRICRKINLYLDYEDALTLADDDINENWEVYKEKVLEGGFP